MIYLIGGAPRLGKSSVARELLKRQTIPWESTDTIRSAVNEALAPGARKEKLPFADVDDHTEVFQRPIDTLITQQLTEAESLQGPIRAWMADHVRAGDPATLEGVHLLPSFVARLQRQDVFQGQLRVIFLVADDKDLLVEGMRADTSPHNWLRGKSSETVEAAADFILVFSRRIEEDAQANGFEVITRTGDLSGDIARCTKHLLQS